MTSVRYFKYVLISCHIELTIDLVILSPCFHNRVGGKRFADARLQEENFLQCLSEITVTIEDCHNTGDVSHNSTGVNAAVGGDCGGSEQGGRGLDEQGGEDGEFGDLDFLQF
jgi:hypothetical protein